MKAIWIKIKENKWSFIVLGVVVIAGLLYIFWPKKDPRDGSKVFDPAAQRLIDSLGAENRLLKYNDSIQKAENDKLREERAKTKVQIKTEYEYRDRIRVIWDTATTATINEYFANRYGRD